jgi:hypothetical protein
MITLAVQVFNKPDTTIQTLESLAKCALADKCKLYILQDSLISSRSTEKYQKDHLATKELVNKWINENSLNFLTINFRENISNSGTCLTGKTLIDWAFEDSKNDLVIFTEDDVIFDVDAIYWFKKQLESELYLDESIWAIAGESKIFDSGSNILDESIIEDAKKYAAENNLLSQFYKLNFLPSTCFGISKRKWGEFGYTRGLPNGDRDVNIRCKEEGKFSLWPVVARCSDIGMHHSSGYSMLIFNDENKITQKNQNIATSDFPCTDLFSLNYFDADKIIGGLFFNYCKKWQE